MTKLQQRYQYFIGILLLILSSISYANQCQMLPMEQTTVKQNLDSNGNFCVTVFFKQQQLIKGTYHSLDQLALFTTNKIHFRQLNSANQTFMFTVPQDGYYQLAAKGIPNQSMNINWQSMDQAQAKPYSLISPELIRLEQQIVLDDNTDTFWQKINQNGTPLVEPYDEHNVIMTFLWRGKLQNIKIFGSPSGDHDDLYQLNNSDVWFRSYIVPKTTRFSYQLAPNIPTIDRPYAEQRRAIIATAQQDPLNPNFSPVDGADKFHRSSYIVLPDAPTQFGIEYESNSPKGTLTEHRFNSRYLNNQRDITIYWPANINDIPQSDINLVILFDSKQYQQNTPIITIMDNLIARQRINPTIMVMVDTLASEVRSQELPPNNTNMADCLANELLPWLKQQGIIVAPQKTVLAGSSFGGLAATYIAFNYPQYFPNVLSLSGSYWWGPKDHHGEWLSEQFATQPTKPIRFYLNAGLFEGNLLISNRHFSHILQAKGYRYFYRETASGHDYLHWQGELAEGLQFLLKPSLEAH